MEKIPGLYVASATHHSIGKTALCLGLALKFGEEGLNVGYFKPLGWHTTSIQGQTVDEDTILMKHLLNLGAPIDAITPILLEDHYLDQYSAAQTTPFLERINKAYQQVSRDKDVVLIEALHEPCLGVSFNLSASELAKQLKSDLLLVSSTQQDTAVDEILFEQSCVTREGTRCAGVVFNRVQKPRDGRIRNVMVPILEQRGIHVWGVIPEAIPLTAPTVKELAETLGGKVLCGEENLSNLVESYLVGAMTQDSAIRYFRRAPRKAVITGGDRPDIALAALETDTSVLILTGDLYPNVRVLAEAEEKGVPILLIPYDTYTTVERVRDTTGKIKVSDEKRINLAKKLVSEHVDWKGLLTFLGLTR